MSKKSTKQNENIRNEANLKYDAVERLASVDKTTAKKVSDKELEKYQKSFLAKVPTIYKACFIKWWFSGAVCFFFFWGLGNVVKNQMDLILVLWIAQGIVTDLLVNPVLRFIQREHEYEKYMMINSKKFASFFLNIIYALPLIVGTIMIYEGINGAIVSINNLPSDSVPLGVGPICFGIFYLVLDLLCLKIKQVVMNLVKKEK